MRYICGNVDAAGIRMPLHRFAGTIRRNKHRDARAHGRLQNPLAQNDVRAGEPSRRWEARWNKWKGQADIGHLFERIGGLPPDSKLASLRSILAELRVGGYGQTKVFTQYTDTMDFLREELRRDAGAESMCFSGRGGEIPSTDGVWRRIGRDDTKRRFRDGEADITAVHRCRRRGLELSVLRRHDQLRYAVEPDAGGAAHRSY